MMITVADLLRRAYGQISSLVDQLTAADFTRDSGASEWSVQDVVFHLLLDAQRALVTFASPTGEPADVDAVSYWRPFRPDATAASPPPADAVPDAVAEPASDSASAHARFVRSAAAAYASPRSLVGQWTDTAAAAVRAGSQAAAVVTRVQTQGHVLEVADFTSTLVVEAAVHHLDLIAHLPEPPQPDPEVLGHARSVLEQIARVRFPSTWSDERAVLVGTGRRVLSDRDRIELGDLVDRLPLLG